MKTGERRRCASCTSYPAAARANGNRRLGRLARRKIADHLKATGLSDTAAAVLAAPPSLLSEFMAAMGINQAVLGDTPMPGDGPASAAGLIATAKSEDARRRAQQPQISSPAPRARLASPPSVQVEQSAAMRLAQAVARNPAGHGNSAGARPATAANVPNCRSNISVLMKWEDQAEEVFAADSTKAQCRVACAEAEMLCKGCPLLESCAQEAKDSHYTGVAGGRIFVNGRHRLTPSSPARIVAA